MAKSIIKKVADTDIELKCSCGSDRFVSGPVIIRLCGIPCTITQDGPQYDDTKAKQSEGWDFNEQNQVFCVDCEKEYAIETRPGGELFLRPVKK